MFKKLKDKIAEEVKSSPQRIQQFTQSVTEKIQNSTSDENFFSIGEDDAIDSSSPYSDSKFTNVSLTPSNGERRRKNSNTSTTSDMSFLPRYESATNLYHLQSDLDVSASEIEDNVSTSSQLGHLSKEQIHAAFQKSQIRYHKYRGRYTDIANHYKDLERENSKMKAVLVETQDKALRRVAELREQCSLEQKAKAHLENALRVELDEKQYVIDTLKTKIDLLQSKNNEEKTSEELLVPESSLKEAKVEIETLNCKLQEMKANAIIYGSKESDLKKRLTELEEAIKQKIAENQQVLERERENNLIIAQTKMELHAEIQNRDSQIETLKKDLEIVRTNLEDTEIKSTPDPKLENLKIQNSKLIDKIEQLEQKCSDYEGQVLRNEQLKVEITTYKTEIEVEKAAVQETKSELLSKLSTIESLTEAKTRVQMRVDELELAEKSYLEKIETFREDTKQNLLLLENRIKEKLALEYEQKEASLRVDFENKLKEISKTNTSLQQTQLLSLEKDDTIKRINEELQSLKSNYEKDQEKYRDLESNHLELIAESSQVRSRLEGSEKEISEKGRQLKEMRDGLTRRENELSALRDVQFKNERLLEQVEFLEKENLEVKQNFETKMIETQDDHKKLHTEILELNLEKVNLQESSASLQEELQKSKIVVEENNKNVVDLKSIVETKVAEITELKNKLTEFEVILSEENNKTKFLQESLQQAADKNQRSEDISKFEETCSKLKQELNDNLTVNKELKKCNEELKKNNDVVEGEITELKLQLSVLQNDNSLNLKNYQDKCNDLEIKVQDNSNLNYELTKINKSLKEENETLSLKVSQLIQQIESQNNKHSLELNNLEHQLLDLESQIADHLRINSELTQLNEELKKDKSNLQADIFILKQVDTESSERLSELVQIEQKNASLQSKLDDLFKENCDIIALRDEILKEKENLKKEIVDLGSQLSKVDEINQACAKINNENNDLRRKLIELASQVDSTSSEKSQLSESIQNLQTELDYYKSSNTTNQSLEQRLNESEKQKHEIERQYNEVLHEKQFLRDELEELKSLPNNDINSDKQLELENLLEKLEQYKSLDMTTRNSISFYETEVQRLKNKNEKLNRKLDETLVTLNHCSELSSSTETEYLKNVLYNYMLGKESLVLARVIAAVCKFDNTQTETILQREQQKQTLLGQLGFY